jgi:amino acid transporter
MAGEAGSPGGPGSASPDAFVRRATGLVREASWVDAAIYNLAWSSVPFAFAFMLLFGLPFYPGGDLYIATIATFVFSAPIAVVYAMLNAAMPRSGGEYVWVSRILHPALGFASNLSWTFWVTYYISIYATYMATYGIAPLMRVFASYTETGGALDVADFFISSEGILVLGIVMVFFGGLVFVVTRGLASFVRVQKWAFAAWMIGAILLPIIVAAFTSRESFLSNFDSYVSALGGPPGASSAMLASAAYTPPPLDWGQSLLLVTLPFYAVGFIFPSVYFSGEIRSAPRTTFASISGAQVLATILLLLLAAAFLGRIGETPLASLGLADLSAIGLGFPVYYVEAAAIASGNLVIGLLITLGMVALFLIYVPQSMIMVSRNLFAWSFDRLLPERVADVSPRTHTPVVASSIIVIVALVIAAVLAYNPEYTALVGLFGLVLTYATVAVAAIAFPYRMRAAYASSPYTGRILGLPSITFVGILALLGSGAIVTILLLDVNSGTSLELNPTRVWLSLGIFLVGIPLYYVIRAIQRGRGVNVDLAFRQVPPE